MQTRWVGLLTYFSAVCCIKIILYFSYGWHLHHISALPIHLEDNSLKSRYRKILYHISPSFISQLKLGNIPVYLSIHSIETILVLILLIYTYLLVIYSLVV